MIYRLVLGLNPASPHDAPSAQRLNRRKHSRNTQYDSKPKTHAEAESRANEITKRNNGADDSAFAINVGGEEFFHRHRLWHSVASWSCEVGGFIQELGNKSNLDLAA
jgi:hypothetical protein